MSDVDLLQPEQDGDHFISTDIGDYDISADEKLLLEIYEEDDPDEDDDPEDVSSHIAEFSHYYSPSDEDSCYLEDRMSFSAEQSYQDDYCKHVYEVDEYYNQKFVEDKFVSTIRKIINDNAELQYLRSYDMSLLAIGSIVIYKKEKIPYVIRVIYDDGIIISHEDNTAMTVTTMQYVRPYEKILTMFNKLHKVMLYEQVNMILNRNNNNCIELYKCYCDYFKLCQQEFYGCLPDDIKTAIRNEASQLYKH